MNECIKEYVRNKSYDKCIAVWGTGKCSEIAERFLYVNGIENYVFADNDLEKIRKGIFHDKQVISPEKVDSNYFILISVAQWKTIKEQLELLGLAEIEDFIWALDLEYYDALISYKDAPKVPQIDYEDLTEIEAQLGEYVDIKKVNWFSENEYLLFEEKLGFQEKYNKSANKRYRRKIMEYYFVDKLLNFDEWNDKDIYLDIGAAGSPFAKYLRESKKINAYALDLSKGEYDELPYYIQEDATKTHFENGEISAISMQSAFEMFIGDADERFLEEASRILKKGGKVLISPLYMHKQYLSTVSPNYYNRGMADIGSLECIRVDCRGSIPLGRFYSVKSLNERILTRARKCGLTANIYSLPNEIVEKDDFVYLKFILLLQKN